MIIYNKTKTEFLYDVFNNNIEDIIESNYNKYFRINVSPSEKRSWKNSLREMGLILNNNNIPNKISIVIEYKIPYSEKRIDMLIAGLNKNSINIMLIVELKQWARVTKTDLDGIVKTFLGSSLKETTHPCYQVWSYVSLLKDYNNIINGSNIIFLPCVYMHNLSIINNKEINDVFYNSYIKKAPIFYREDKLKFQEFILNHICQGDSNNIIDTIDRRNMRPSLALMDNVLNIIDNPGYFTLLDTQKIAFENINKAIKNSYKGVSKNVFIIKGEPGSGKSIIAINLLLNCIKQNLIAKYISKNSAPRDVYVSKLGNKKQYKSLFASSDIAYKYNSNHYDCLLIDEAHRLTNKSGFYKNLGNNQIEEIINCAKISVFFIDENQSVTIKDIGTIDSIKKIGHRFNAEIKYFELNEQFRCLGSKNYIDFIDYCLGIKTNFLFEDLNYDIQIFTNPNELRHEIIKKNNEGYLARIVAGYCWNWNSKDNIDLYDINIDEYGFQMRWNLKKDGNLWLVNQNSISEAGCIHTCQGLEMDYIGVIVGKDFLIRDNQIITDLTKRAKHDKSIIGYKKMMKDNPIKLEKIAQQLVVNTYRTLMTRGTKGCYIFCDDIETNNYFIKLIDKLRVLKK